MKIAGNWLKSCLIATTLSACASPCLKEIEKDLHIYDMDIAHGVCGKHKVLSLKPFKTKFVSDLPLRECDGFFALSTRDMQKIKRCAETAEGCSK